MFMIGDIIKNKYLIESIPEDQGGMGKVCFVRSIVDGGRYAIKYCDDFDEELRNRFRREARLLLKYINSEFVVPIFEFALEDEPPMFVMLRADDDLLGWIPNLYQNLAKQEAVFLRMVECIQFLHNQQDVHRDIKPRNFLVFGERIVVSDLGLAKDPSSATEMTRSIDARGTPGFYPPQFLLRNGFRRASNTDDIFMLGKSFFQMLTGEDPSYLDSNLVHPILFRVIEKCCHPDQKLRYQTCYELKTALVSAYDILLGRTNSDIKYQQLKGRILKSTVYGPTLTSSEVEDFFHLLSNEPTEEQVSLIENIPTLFVAISLGKGISDETINQFIMFYRKFLKYAFSKGFYPFPHAETVATQMTSVFTSSAATKLKVEALHIALEISIRFSRSAAAQTCVDMIESIKEDVLASAVAELLRTIGPEPYLQMVDLSQCRHFLIIKTVKELLKQQNS